MIGPDTNGRSISRRRFLASAAAWACPPLLLNCRQAPAIANQVSEASALHVADFRQRGLSDREVLKRAFEAWIPRGGTLHLEPNRRYELGFHADGSNVFALSGMENAVLAGNGATLAIHTRGSQKYNFFYLQHYRNLRIENLAVVDTGYADSPYVGAMFIVLDAAYRDSVDITLDNVSGEGLVSFIQAQGVAGGPRVRGIRIMPNCRAERVFYVLVCMNNGDDLSGGFSTVNCARSYFPYGVTNHDVSVRIHHEGAGHGPAAETAIPIKSYNRPTSNIRLRARFSGTLSSSGTCVSIEHQNDPGGPPSIIEDVDARIYIEPGTRDPHGSHRFIFRCFDARDQMLSGPTRNIWRRIRIGGDLRPSDRPAIFSPALPASPPEIFIAPGTSGLEPRSFAARGFRFRAG